MQDFTTPMMKQYETIKKQYKDCLLLYRMGDFYELFLDDAIIGAKILGITLTSRAKGRDGRIPMAGVPYHAIDTYLSKLVKAGHKVAICEQLSEPNKKGLVERDVVRIVTPGTLLDEQALIRNQNNYIVSVLVTDESLAVSFCDISTGQFQTMQIDSTDPLQILQDELARLHPTECILPPNLYEDHKIIKSLKTVEGINIFSFQNWTAYAEVPKKFLTQHFHVQSLAGFGLEGKNLAQQTSAMLLGYLQETQKGNIGHIQTITLVENSGCVLMDRSTILNLELFSTIRERDSSGSLLSVIDHTHTPMGGRLLKQWLLQPLTSAEAISKRLDTVEFFVTHSKYAVDIRASLDLIVDIERILSRLSVGIGNPRDMVNLKRALQYATVIRHRLSPIDVGLIPEICSSINKSIDQVITFIHEQILEEPAISLKEGGIIKDGIDSRIDSLRETVFGGKEWVTKLEKEERARTGIGSLKVRFNKVFGFYIEVSTPNAHLVPADYMRKQTLVNGERFITSELKKHEELMVSAESELYELEYRFFQKILAKLLEYTDAIQTCARGIAMLDCVVGFAHVATEYRYTRPKIIFSGEITITDGRHPVVERLCETPFVPNSVHFDPIKHHVFIITGPNMAGKSVLLRQVALLTLLTHIGSYISAGVSHISLVDRIFVRSGASDMITSGLSTFMVEMTETAYILNHATKNSLIIMDEIGRGTSTYDGISIAWAVAQYIVQHVGAKTLFATHYHELQELEKQFPDNISNYHMAVVEEENRPVFLHTLMKGGASASFGVAVAKLAGVPQTVVEHATDMLHSLEKMHTKTSAKQKVQDAVSVPDPLRQKLATIDIAQTTPLKALQILSDLKEL